MKFSEFVFPRIGMRAGRSIAIALALSGCGGSSSDTAPISSPDVKPTPPSSMVPAAPPKGEVLYTDATVLRVLRPYGNLSQAYRQSATWTYRGSHTGKAGATSYQNTVTQDSIHEGVRTGVIEDSTNLFGGGKVSVNVFFADGSVKLIRDTSSPLSDPSTAVIDTELNAAVRQNDQYAVTERHVADSGTDVDSDGKNDAMDVATYRLVVGNEMVALPNSAPVTALRVDMIKLVRYFSTSKGQYTPVTKTVQSSWYAAAMGVVRQRLVTPSASGVDDVFDEYLVAWDGVGEGLGVTDMKFAVHPGTLEQDSQVGVADLFGAVPFSEHSVLRTGKPKFGSITDAPGFYFTLIGMRGEVIKYMRHPDISSAGVWDMVKTTKGFAMVSRASGEGTGIFHLFNSSAYRESGPEGIPYSLRTPDDAPHGVIESVADSDGSGLWMFWSRGYPGPFGSYKYQLVLRKYDYSGGAQGAPFVVETLQSGFRSSDLKISAAGGKVVATWKTSLGVAMYAALSSDEGPVVIKKLDSGERTFGSPIPLAQGGSGKPALFWAGFSDSPGSARALGVTLDPVFNPLLAPGNTTSFSETLSQNWGGAYKGSDFAASGLNGRFVTTASVEGKLYPDVDASPLYVVADYPPSNGAISTAMPNISRISMSPYMISAGPLVVKQLVFPDRVIVLFGNSKVLSSVVVWRRN